MSDNGALALASILHDTYGCRITCRSGRLANDRHPSHAEAYLDTATAVLASLDAAGWALVRDAGNPLADREQAATIATLRAQYAAQLNLTIEANSTIATLRAALEAWKRVAKKYRFLYRLYLREQSDWRTALRLAGISAMGDLNPDAIRLTITVPREKRINEMVEERIAARATAKEAGE